MVWFDQRPLDLARDYLIKHTTQTVPARVEAVEYRVNVTTLHAEQAVSLSMNDIGVVRITTARPLFVDAYRDNRGTGAFILIDRGTNATAGAGMILSAAETSTENAADRLARLVRAVVPPYARLDLPADDEAAAAALRAALRGVLK